MKIVLSAIEKEENNELALLSLVSYVHMGIRKTHAQIFLFPSRRFIGEMKEGQKSALTHLARDSHILLGVGFYENRRDVYRLFAADGQVYELRSQSLLLLEICGQKMYFSLKNVFPANALPAVLIGHQKGQAGKVQFLSFPSRETYYLGKSGPEEYEALVFENHKVKCRLPGDHPNLLVKSVPASFADGQ